MLQKKILKKIKNSTIIILASFFVFFSCEKEENIKAEFSYKMIDANHVEFTNESEGDYYMMTWTFGNSQTETTTEKRKTFEIYYPEAGDYEVSLTISSQSGSANTITKIVNIATPDIQPSFTAMPNPSKPNYITLTNTTTGDYTSFKWKYNNTEVENENIHEAYFPLAGNYEIVLEIEKAGNVFSKKQLISIGSDDPDYDPGMSLVWSDEFDGTFINSQVWNYDLGTGDWGWGNDELQSYTNTNETVVDGKLIMTAKKVNDNTERGSYTSTRINTLGKKSFQYGRIEIRAKLPSGRGVWPAIWMLGNNLSSAGWPACGEMDIMEYVGYEPDVIHSTVHTTSGSGGNGSGSSATLTTCEEEFHIYGLDWTKDKLVFYTDTPDNVTHTYAPAIKNDDTWPFNQPAFFILNLAVGGTWGGAQGVDNSIFPQTMEVDYVRVYQ